jgi:prepilin-type N-terminal cleavage/methylation domain-containing protein
MNKRGQAGFTLVEMMVVVAILIVLTTLAGVTVRSGSKPVDVAHGLSNLLDQASRDAVRYGMVRADVATTLGSKSRTRVRGTAGPTFIAEVLIEDPTAAWHEIGRYTVPTSVTADGFATIVGTRTEVGTLTTDWSDYLVSCFPNGNCTSSTAFFSTTTGPEYDRQARVSTLPIGGSTYVRKSWN